MDSTTFRHTESEKLEKSEISLFKKCAKLFKYETEIAAACGISRQKLWDFRRTYSGNAKTLEGIRSFISEYKDQIAA